MVNSINQTNNLTLPVRFRGVGTPPRTSANAFLRTFDFNELGRSTIKQNMLLYVGIIASRLVASAERGKEIDSYNEFREHALRDILGWTFWFLAVDPVKRTYLRFAPEKYREMLVNNPYKAPIQPVEGLWENFVERTRREASFIFKGGIPTAEQLENRKSQILKQTSEAVKDLGEETLKDAKADVEKLFHKLARYRSFASGFGIVSAIALLGVGIPIINILTTRQKVLDRETEKHGIRPNLSEWPLNNRPAFSALNNQNPFIFSADHSKVYRPSYFK